MPDPQFISDLVAEQWLCGRGQAPIFRPYFEAVGLDIDDPQFGLFIERHLHLSSKDEYNAMWWDFLKQYTVEEWPNHQLEFLEFLRILKTVF